MVADVGCGYYDCLHKKACAKNKQDTYDPAMKQVEKIFGLIFDKIKQI